MAIQRKCAECGVLVNHQDGFRMDVYAPLNDDLYTIFCRQDHAAHWLTKPLPQAMPEEPFTRSDGVALLAFVALIALAVIGVVALVQGVDVNPF